MANTPKELLDLFPTVEAVADDLDFEKTVKVQRWRDRNSIPARYGYPIFLALKERGTEITEGDVLRAMSGHTEKRRNPSRSVQGGAHD